jgi:hypothetical protein
MTQRAEKETQQATPLPKHRGDPPPNPSPLSEAGG